MMPMLMVMKVATHDGRDIRLWLPLFLVWILLAPLALLALPFVIAAGVIFRVNPFTAVAAVLGLLMALSGVHLEVKAPGASVLVHVI
jgi:hypothetical protein